jgi:hypothetical protein
MTQDVITMDRKEQDLNNSTTPIPTVSQQLKEEQELWTTEYLVDQLFLCLARTKEYVATNKNDVTVPVKKYYSQARRLMKWIPIARPAPEFVINISNLTPKTKSEIASISQTPTTLQYVLTQAVGRIFENIDFEYYHLSLARNLLVRFEP